MLVEVGNANLHLRDVDTFRSAIDWIKISVRNILLNICSRFSLFDINVDQSLISKESNVHKLH